MKETMRKIMLVIVVIFFGVFSSLAYPMQQAKAGPLVGGLIPAGITAGAGAYLGGALMLSGLVGVAGYHEYQKSINDHAWNVWDGGTQGAKDNMQWLVEQSVSAGNSVVNVSGEAWDYLGSQIPSMSKELYNIQAGNYDYDPALAYTYQSSFGSVKTSKVPTGYSFYYAGQPFPTVQVNYSTGYVSAYLTGATVTGKRSVEIRKSVSPQQYEEFYNMIVSATTPEAVMNAAIAMGLTFSTAVVAEVEAGSIGIQNQMQETWETVRDAGLVLPVDGVTSYVGDVQVRPNAAGDSYTDDAGLVYSPGDVTHAFPQPRIRTQDVPEAGVYTDTPALTGNPTIDEAITSNPAIPKTTTNIHTGTTIANPDIATGNPSIPINPPITAVPPFDAPGTTGLDFTPLMMTGEAMTNKFPFSIPFDFVRQIRVFDVEPVAPSFDIDIPEFIKLGGFVIPFKMKLSFEMFDPIANIIRWGMIIIWDISLIFAIRKLLPE